MAATTPSTPITTTAPGAHALNAASNNNDDPTLPSLAQQPTRSSTMPALPLDAPACAVPPPGERTRDFAAAAQADADSDSQKISQKPPSRRDLDRVGELTVIDVEGKERTFGSLFEEAVGEERYERVLVLFVRHFFCGNCQEFLSTLTTSLPATLPPKTQIIIVGHGSHELIPFYAAATSCPFPMYADPSKQLYAELGMARTLSLGPDKPEYMRRSMPAVIWRSIVLNLMQGRRALKGGDYFQVGGELVLERVAEPSSAAGAAAGAGDDEGMGARWRCGWIHRMQNTRDHAEVPVILRKLLSGTGDDEDKSSVDAGVDLPEAASSSTATATGAGAGAGVDERASSSSEDEVARVKAAAAAATRQRSADRKRWSGVHVPRSLSLRRRSRSPRTSKAGTRPVAVA